MKSYSRFVIPAVFALGLGAGLGLSLVIPDARADKVEWETLAQNPEFRRAVVEVINSCLVDNSIIYCN